jgi:hypothetical protein
VSKLFPRATEEIEPQTKPPGMVPPNLPPALDPHTMMLHRRKESTGWEPGDRLEKKLKWLTDDDEVMGQGCNSCRYWIEYMNAIGPVGCRRELDKIVDRLMEQAGIQRPSYVRDEAGNVRKDEHGNAIIKERWMWWQKLLLLNKTRLAVDNPVSRAFIERIVLDSIAEAEAHAATSNSDSLRNGSVGVTACNPNFSNTSLLKGSTINTVGTLTEPRV